MNVTPDPAWDYFTIWQLLEDSKQELDSLLENISKMENASPSTDIAIKQAVYEITQILNSARRLI